jgi:hypothetical protein
MHTPDIFKALETLNPDDDDHWTSDHAPRLDVLEPFIPGVTREMIRRAAPLFTRLHPELPDLAAERLAAEEAMRVAQDAENKALEARKVANQAQTVVKTHETEIRDRHTLTRQNRRWIDSQFDADRARAAHQKNVDEAVKNAGGVNMIGVHPVEKNMAARIRADRKKDIVLPKKKAG